MWKTMADSHRIQKRAIEDARLLPPNTNPSTPPHAGAATLATEIRTWRRCFANWIDANRSYAGALAGWACRCASPESMDALPPVIGLCRKWWRVVESVREEKAKEGMEFFAAGMASVRVGAPELGKMVLCAGMSAAVGAVAEFAGEAAEGYEGLVRKCGGKRN